MIYLNYYCTDVVFLVAMVFVTLSFTIRSLIIFNCSLLFKITLLLVEMSTCFNYEIHS